MKSVPKWVLWLLVFVLIAMVLLNIFLILLYQNKFKTTVELEVHIYQSGAEYLFLENGEKTPLFYVLCRGSMGALHIACRYFLHNSAYHDFLDSLQTGDSGALARAVAAQNWPHLLLGGFLPLNGPILLLFALILVGQGGPVHPSIYYCALFVLSCSLWILLNPIYSTLVLDNAPLIMLLGEGTEVVIVLQGGNKHEDIGS